MSTKTNLTDSILAPYAMQEELSRGRKHAENEHPYRNIYQRDRDRIIHCAAFRKLEFKTQVFVFHEGDYYRTRLTHTIEVAQIARTIAKALSLNEGLAETIALAHDLGHTPFGHAGEDILNNLMREHGGFNHNIQTLRIVELLEERYPDFPGLNLTWEVREGIAKHTTNFDTSVRIQEYEPDKKSSLEAQIVDLADEIAYNNHDLDDGLTSGLLGENNLEEVSLWNETVKEFKIEKLNQKLKHYSIIRNLINIFVTDLIDESNKRIKKFKIKSLVDVKKSREKIIAFSDEMTRKRKQLSNFLEQNLYKHHRVIRMADKAKRFIEDLFRVYSDNPQTLPKELHEKLKKGNKFTVICDYIAGMTDRSALDEHKKLFDPYERV